jgi:hypothetical protein
MNLGPNQEQQELLQSTPLVQVSAQQTGSKTVNQLGGDSYTEVYVNSLKTGARPVGWIVRQMVDGKLVRVQASSSEYERAGSDPAALKALQDNAPPAPVPGRPAPGQKR